MTTIRLNPDRVKFNEYYQWHNGNLSTLFQEAPNIVNGLSYVKPNEVQSGFNYFAAQSRFYADAMLADIPENNIAYDIIRKLTRDWSITGEAVLVTADGQQRVVQPNYFYPRPARDDSDVYVVYYFVFPILNEQDIPTNRARVIEFDPATGEAFMGNRNYSGGYIGEPEVVSPVNIERIDWLRTEDGAYGQMESLVREINMRQSVTQSALNRNAFPILSIDRDLVADGQFATGNPSTEQVADLGRQGIGITVPPAMPGEDRASYIERLNPLVAESMDYLRLLFGQLTIASGVPDYIYGVNLGQPAAETERILFAGQAKVNRFRKLITELFGIVYANEPFVTRKGRIETLIMLLNAGIITQQEARGALGFNG